MSEQLAFRAAAAAFTVLYAVATFLPRLPEGAYDDQTVLGLVNDAGSRTAILVGGWALTLAGLVFLVWTAALTTRLDPGGSWPARAALLGGVGYGLALMLAATAFTGVATGIAVGELPAAEDPYLVRLVSDLGFHLLLVPGLLCASLAVAATSALGRRSGALPPAVTVLGAVVAPLLWAGPLWAPQFLVPVWMLVVALTLRPATSGEPTAEASIREPDGVRPQAGRPGAR